MTDHDNEANRVKGKEVRETGSFAHFVVIVIHNPVLNQLKDSLNKFEEKKLLAVSSIQKTVSNTRGAQRVNDLPL